MTKQKWTPKRVTRDIVLVLVVLTTAVMVPVGYLASQVRRDISEQFISNASAQAVEEFQTMAASMEATLGLVRDWGATEVLSLDDADGLGRLLFPIFGREQLLYGISIADVEGNNFYLRREGEGYRSRRITAGRKDRKAETITWNAEFERGQSSSTNSLHDPRNRPWFAPALAQEEIFWTEPYTFFSVNEVGITASTSYTNKKENRTVVVAFDILLEDLFGKMHAMAPGDNGRIFIFRRDAKLYIPESETIQADFLAMGKVKDQLARKVHERWSGDADLAGRVFSVMHDGAIWWCGFQPLENTQHNTWICVMVPESDIHAQAGQRSRRLWLLGLIPMLIATTLAFWIAQRYSRAFASASSFNSEDPEGSVRSLIEKGENRAVEFKSTLRMNLHSKKPGKEIELAWLKGVAAFLNTDGGILLLGVTDDGEVTGIERDVFENEDKCRLHFKNLIGKHIGADLSKYIRFILVPMDGKTVGVVLCARADEPVFLKEGSNKEHFYIRNGPASDELPVSQALNYIKHRG